MSALDLPLWIVELSSTWKIFPSKPAFSVTSTVLISEISDFPTKKSFPADTAHFSRGFPSARVAWVMNETGSNEKIKGLLKQLARADAPEAASIASCIGDMATGNIDPILIAGFLTALRVSRLDRRPEVVAATATVMRAKALQLEHDESAWGEGFVDIVGTGGDGQNTFNVSTTAAIVASGAGCKVCKHGNIAASSSSGSADLLRSLGCSVSSVRPENINAFLKQSNFCFLFAQVFHPGMKFVAPVRKALGIPTIFNFLGPLVNPARLKARVVGVASLDLGMLFAQSLVLLGSHRSFVVCGEEGLDEISIAGPTRLWKIVDAQVVESTITPEDFGISRRPLSEAKSGSPEENAAMLKRLISGQLEDGNAVLDFVLINAAALLVVSEQAKDWKEGVALARKSIQEGSAKKELDTFVEATKCT